MDRHDALTRFRLRRPAVGMRLNPKNRHTFNEVDILSRPKPGNLLYSHTAMHSDKRKPVISAGAIAALAEPRLIGHQSLQIGGRPVIAATAIGFRPHELEPAENDILDVTTRSQPLPILGKRREVALRRLLSQRLAAISQPLTLSDSFPGRYPLYALPMAGGELQQQLTEIPDLFAGIGPHPLSPISSSHSLKEARVCATV